MNKKAFIISFFIGLLILQFIPSLDPSVVYPTKDTLDKIYIDDGKCYKYKMEYILNDENDISNLKYIPKKLI